MRNWILTKGKINMKQTFSSSEFWSRKFLCAGESAAEALTERRQVIQQIENTKGRFDEYFGIQ